MDILNNGTVKLVIFILAAINEALLKFPGLPPIVGQVCGVLAPVFVALLGGSLYQGGVALRRAKAELLELKGGK